MSIPGSLNENVIAEKSLNTDQKAVQKIDQKNDKVDQKADQKAKNQPVKYTCFTCNAIFTLKSCIIQCPSCGERTIYKLKTNQIQVIRCI